jgi:hypothetical protein
MRDSVVASRIPLNTDVVAGYADGFYEWSASDWARFPNAVHLTIAVHAVHAADVLDVEQGDATPAEVPGWCDRFSRPGRRAPTIYCNLSSWPACKAAAGARRVDWWIATLNGLPTVGGIPGAVAEQFVQHTDPVFHYDESVIYDLTWVDFAPAPPAPTPPGDDMSIENARITAWGWYPSILRRPPGAQSEVEYWAKRLVDEHWSEQVITDFVNTPEAQAALHLRP